MKTTKNNPNRWPGYTLDELRQRMFHNGVSLGVAGRHLAADVSTMRHGKFWLRKNTYKAIFKAFSYADILILGIKAYRKFAPLLRRQK